MATHRPTTRGCREPDAHPSAVGRSATRGGSRAGGSSSAETHSTTTAAELYDPARGTWSATGAMAIPRVLHTATLLETGVDAGEVLVTGGENAPSRSVASAELYDPDTGTWSPTGGMAANRAGHTATLLPSGKVLIVGGNFGQGPAAELYDPSTDSFSPTGPMPLDPAFHSATLLRTGEVLIAGGLVPSAGHNVQTAAAELYEPATDSWSQTAAMSTARDLQSATLLSSGEVLIAGGYNPELGTLASAELYDPTTGTFSATGSMGLARWEPTATLLGTGTHEGEVLLSGGSLRAVTEAGPRSSAAEIYDPAFGDWATTGPVAFPRLEHKATLLPSGQVLVAGGDLGTPANSLSSAELFTPGSATPAAAKAARRSRKMRLTSRAKGRKTRVARHRRRLIERSPATRRPTKRGAAMRKARNRHTTKKHKQTAKRKRPPVSSGSVPAADLDQCVTGARR